MTARAPFEATAQGAPAETVRRCPGKSAALGSAAVAFACAISWPSRAAAIGPEDDAAPRRRVTFETSEKMAYLERREPVWVEDHWTVAWRSMCPSPCMIDLPVTGLYRVGGIGIKNSRAFRLSDSAGELHIHATPRSSTGWGWGLAGLISASVFLPIGGLLLAIAPGCDQRVDPDCKKGLTLAGATNLTMGILAAGGGLYLILSNQTDVSLTPSVPQGSKTVPLFFGLSLGREGVVF